MKHPLLPSGQADPKPVETHLASTGLRAYFHEVPKTLPYKVSLAGEIPKGKILGDLINESFIQIS